MSLSVNDLLQKPWTRVQMATGDAALTGRVRIMAACINHTATATCILYNALTQTGTDLITVRAAIGNTGVVQFGSGGTLFDVGLSMTLSAGTGTVFYIAE